MRKITNEKVVPFVSHPPHNDLGHRLPLFDGIVDVAGGSMAAWSREEAPARPIDKHHKLVN